MLSRTVFEWQKLSFGNDANNPNTIPEDIAVKLDAAAKASPLSEKGGVGVLELRHKDLRTRGIVGVIVSDSCLLEILPKIDRPAISADESQFGNVRQSLIHMLATVFDLKIDVGRSTALGWQNENLLEILIKIFSEKLADAVRKGMPHRYVRMEDDLSALRGALDVTRQFSRHAVNPSRLACRFDVLSGDIVLNRIMRAAIRCLSRISRNHDNQQRLRELLFIYSDVADIHISELRWDEVVIDRTNMRWKELLSLAEMLLKRRFQTTNLGSGHGFSLLFEMNKLFEEYIGRLMERAASGTGYQVSLQGGRKDCLFEVETDLSFFQTKPDILIRRGGDITHIVDTKWKRMTPKIDDPKQGVSQADVYQMMAYGRIYNCTNVLLLYPHHAVLPSEKIFQHYSIGNAKSDESLFVATIDLSASKHKQQQDVRALFSQITGFEVNASGLEAVA